MEYLPSTYDRWLDLEKLFGEKGACAGCWCMYWRTSHKEFEEGKGEANKKAFQEIVSSGEIPGLLAYEGDEPVGWCAVAPRSRYVRLTTSRILEPLDDRPVWSVPCFFIKKEFRRKGVATGLLRAAVEFVRAQGGTIVEGYPVEPKEDIAMAPAFAWTGLASSFRAAGFEECARRSETRPIMRYYLP